ncbi:hypothetical protein [Acinetobacter sp. TTH0-4]|uniref:hypothetical protein n=1 Tax=Acinetobacter sp. TTH0-4 TaxID=1646498 RepID=UPI0006AF2C56|nr:hypothetical protein [Acinetobacter sp. TTH0-4]
MPNFIKPVYWGLLFHPIIMISICTDAHANTSPIAVSTPQSSVYPNIDRDLSENFYPNEAKTAEKIADIIEMSIRKDYSTGLALRDAHPKAHGCVRAEFKIDEALPKTMAQGIFIPGRTYRALMCAEKTGGFNLVNYRHSSGVYHEQETEDLHRRI